MGAQMLALLGLVLGGISLGSVGFAFAMFANAGLALALPPSVAVPTVLLVGNTLNLALIYENRVALRWETLRCIPPFAPFSIPFVLAGLAAGSFLLGALNPAVGRLGLGVVVLTFVGLQVLGWTTLRTTGRVSLSVAALASGLLNGWLGTGGVAITMYLTALRPGRDAFVMALAANFLASDVFRAMFYALHGYWTTSVLRWYVILLPVALASYAVGVALRRRITSPAAFRRAVLIILAVIGLGLLARGALS